MGKRPGPGTTLPPGSPQSVTDTVTDWRPMGKEAVVSALTAATIDLLVEHGTDISVRQIAARAGVNHGLVHTYFGSKRALLSAALDEVVRRAAADFDDAGFPPPDLASRRGGELAKALARVRLDDAPDLLASYPIVDSWRAALTEARPDLDEATIEANVITASALALGWAVFADHLCEATGADAGRRAVLDDHVAGRIADIGGLPARS